MLAGYSAVNSKVCGECGYVCMLVYVNPNVYTDDVLSLRSVSNVNANPNLITTCSE